METTQVLEEMFGAYKAISLERIDKERVERNVCFEGKLVEYLQDTDGFFMELEDGISLKYVPQIGISVKKMEKLCKIAKKYNPNLKIYGKIVREEGEESKFREIEVHAIEFEAESKKVRYPNAEMIEGSDKKKPIPYVGTDSFEHQVIEKEFHRIHHILNTLEEELDQKEKKEKIDKLLKGFDKPKTEQGRDIDILVEVYLNNIIAPEKYQDFKDGLQRAEAELEFYKIFDDAKYNAERKLKENAPGVQILEGEINEDAILRL